MSELQIFVSPPCCFSLSTDSNASLTRHPCTSIVQPSNHRHSSTAEQKAFLGQDAGRPKRFPTKTPPASRPDWTRSSHLCACS